MKKIEKEVVTKVVEGYEAMDGTMFADQEECKKYEQSAKGVLRGRLKKITIKTELECNIFNSGGENEVWVTKPQSEADIDTIRQLYYLGGGREEYLPKNLDEQVGKIVFVTFAAYDENDVWLDTMEALMERIMGENK